jgi:virulence factor Mce-like protein
MASNKGRKDPTKLDFAKRGLVAVAVAALAMALLYGKSSGVLSSPDQVTAHLVNAGGSLPKGADVKSRGVIVGRVNSITRASDGGVLVKLTLSDGQLEDLPANVVARILPATVFGTSFVDLTIHGPASAQPLARGAIVPADTTQGTLELQQALDDIDRLVKALGPGELASALGSAAQALDGRGEQIGSMIDRLDDYLHQLNPEMGQVRSDVAKLASNLEILRKAAPDLLDAVDDGLVTARTIVVEQATIATIITGGIKLVDQGSSFLDANQASLVRFLNSAGTLLDALYDNRVAAFTDALDTNHALSVKIPSLIHHGWALVEVNPVLAVPDGYSGRQAASRTAALSRTTLSSMVTQGAVR